MEESQLGATKGQLTNNFQLIVDVGGTSTSVALASEGCVVRRTELPSFKPAPYNYHTAELCKAIGSWLATASQPTPLVSFVMLGVSGIWDGTERQSYLNSFADSWETYTDVVVPRCSVVSDLELALFAAFGSSPGTLLIAGTGSIAAQRLADGTIRRCGGWGPHVDDVGGGRWVGTMALRAVARALDGRKRKTNLVRPVAAYLRCNGSDITALRNALRNTTASNVARLAPAVLQYATEGDTVAAEIRSKAAEELVGLLLPILSSAATSRELCMHGSLFRDAAFVTLCTSMITEIHPELQCTVMLDVVEQTALRLHSRS